MAKQNKIKISECPYYKNGGLCMHKHKIKLFGKKCVYSKPFKCPIYINFIERLKSTPKQEKPSPSGLNRFKMLFHKRGVIK